LDGIYLLKKDAFLKKKPKIMYNLFSQCFFGVYMSKLPFSIEYMSGSSFEEQYDELWAERAILKAQKNMQKFSDSSASYSLSDDESSSIPYERNSAFARNLDALFEEHEKPNYQEESFEEGALSKSLGHSYLDMMFPYEEDLNPDNDRPVSPKERSPVSVAESILSPRTLIKEIKPNHITSTITKKNTGHFEQQVNHFVEQVSNEASQSIESLPPIQTMEYSVFKPKRAFHLDGNSALERFAEEHHLQMEARNSISSISSEDGSIFTDVFSDGEEMPFTMSN
jgi:hypothetical protein